MSESSQALTIRLTAFEGPFDLLLHLIKELEVDINDIPMAQVTDQYLAYVHQMQPLDLDLIGDYLVMAATLLEIKSRLLIPIEPDQADLEGEWQDPREGLVQQLLVYQQFQKVADALEDHQATRSANYSRPQTDLSAYQANIPLQEGEVSLDSLSQAMLNVLKRQLDRQPAQKEIHQDQVSIPDKIQAIRSQLASLDPGDRIEFNQLLRNASRPEIIASFMAVLELVRQHEVQFIQEGLYAPIQIMRREEGEP